MPENKPTILVCASTFPRWKNDTEPGFIYELCTGLKEEFNIIVLTSHYCGAEKHEIMNGLEIYRYRYSLPQFETLVYNGGIVTNLKKNPWKYLLLPPFLIAQLFWILKLIYHHPASVIHAHWIIPQGFLSLLALRISNKPIKILCTSHGSDLFGLNDPLSSKLKRWVLKNVNIVTVVSRAMFDTVKKIAPETQSAPLIAPMGTDLKQTFYANHKIARKDNILLYTGRLVDNKGIDLLIRSIPVIKQQFPSITLKIVGDGPKRASLQELARQLNIEKNVIFFGSIKHENLAKFYSEATLAVFPFQKAQGFGLVLVEALGCACPVIVSDVPAIHDIITNKQTGLIVPVNNIDILIDKIIWSLNNPEQLKTFAVNGRMHVLNNFDWEIIHQKYIKLLTSLTIPE